MADHDRDHDHDSGDDNTVRDATACGKCHCPSFEEKPGTNVCNRGYCGHSSQQHTG